LSLVVLQREAEGLFERRQIVFRAKLAALRYQLGI
jgi:hypothetical protein